MKILLISTLNHNPGDDFIRLGLEYILRKVFENPTFRVIHKHDPRTLFAGFTQRTKTPNRFVSPLLYRFYANTYGRNKENYLETANMVVFAGTPFIWRMDVSLFPSTCANAEWVQPIWRRLFRELQDKPVLNLAAGSGLYSKSQFASILADPKVSGFLKRAMKRTRLTTVRDPRAKEILSALGFDPPVIPCSSILASKGAMLQPQQPEYVAINLMPSTTHRRRGLHTDDSKWRDTIKVVVPSIEKRHKVMFVSHSPDEDAAAAEWFPGRPRFLSKDPVELLKVYAKASYGICNRVHAGAAVATFGRPVVVIGGDTRIQLIEQFGMPVFDQKDVNAEKLNAAIEEIERCYGDYIQTVKARTEFTEREYINTITASLPGLLQAC